MSYWTHYWKNDTVENQRRLVERGSAPDDDKMSHTAGNMFRQRGVVPGDVVYIVTRLKGGSVHLVGRLVVESIVEQGEAERRLDTADLWVASGHLVARKPWSKCRFDVTVPKRDLSKVVFIGSDGTLSPLAYNRHGEVDQQTLRSLRQITKPTADLFDSLLR